jgi:hypothetical protein
MMQGIKHDQGPAGQPKGKKGMTKALLRCILAFLSEKKRTDPRMKDFYLKGSDLVTHWVLKCSRCICLYIGNNII